MNAHQDIRANCTGNSGLINGQKFCWKSPFVTKCSTNCFNHRAIALLPGAIRPLSDFKKSPVKNGTPAKFDPRMNKHLNSNEVFIWRAYPVIRISLVHKYPRRSGFYQSNGPIRNKFWTYCRDIVSARIAPWWSYLGSRRTFPYLRGRCPGPRLL